MKLRSALMIAGWGTRIHVQLSYTPPAGAVGHSLAALLGADPKQAMDEDLVRFKSLIEEGKARVHGERIDESQLSAGTAGARSTEQ